MERHDLNALERLFVAVALKIGEYTEGYRIGFVPELVRQHGISGLMKWGKKTQAAWEELAARYGEKDGHLLASLASFWNGCDYCAYGHMLAYNLHHFEETGELFAIDEAEVPHLLRKRDSEVLQHLREQMSEPQFQPVLALLDRQYALKSETVAPSTEQDAHLMKSIGLYEWINECSITVEAPAPPLGKIAKKKDLALRYAEARKLARAANPLPPQHGEHAAPVKVAGA